MQILENINLKPFNTFGIDANARYFSFIENEELIPQIIKQAIFNDPNFQLLILGGGSNILLTDNFAGWVVHPTIMGIEVLKSDENKVIIRAGAGVKWDDFVEFAVNHEFCGLENLSLIPGTVGACPVQNIGAYGVEVADCIFSVEAYDFLERKFLEIPVDKCDFSYRNSIFKSAARNRYFIHHVKFQLDTKPVLKTHYGQIAQEIAKSGLYSIRGVREAVISIRQAKLPDPELIGNAGSFFKNPVVAIEKAEEIKLHYPDLPAYPDPSGKIKLAAGWLIEQTGVKGLRIGNAGAYEKQALILVNYGNATGTEILETARFICNKVEKKFGLKLDYEVNIV
jgi:UDP-N-acetylmuramate dehydrogenase